MALVQETIQLEIEAMLIATGKLSLEQSKKKFAEDLAGLIIAAIKSATITVQPGIITVTGSPSAQANAAPILIENSIT
jgi:hypothetical protein